MFKNLVAIVVVFSFLGMPAVYGQQIEENVSQQEVKQEISIEEEGYVSLDFREADIKNVLEVLALKSGINIVVSPQVSGAISVKLDNVRWQQALDVILQTNGYASQRNNNIILVTTVDSLKKIREDAALLSEQESLKTQTFTLNFSKADKIIESIEKMKSARGSVNFDERTNTLIITDVTERIELIGEVIKKLDSTTPQVSIEAKIVETTVSDQEKLGIDWVAQASAAGSQMATTWPFKSNYTDKRYFPYPFPGPDDTAGSDNIDFTYGTLNLSQVQAVFEMLNTKTDTNILSNPRIVTLDNQKATIKIGEQYPIPQYTYNEEQGRLQVSGWTYKDIGIIFNVTPHVNEANFVTLDVEPKITAITTFVTVENTSLPRLSNESAKTSVVVKGGDTLVIGGLIKNQTSDTKKKLPFFGDIPIVGLLFQKKEQSITKTDLLIFITPHIVTPKIEG